MSLQIVTPRQSLPRKQAYIATSNRKVDNEVMEKKIMLGNEAFARGAYEAGVKVVSSYPGTPSTEVTENAAKYDEIYVEWAPNEKVGVEVAVGASIGGVRSLSCMKHVGLNVAADPFFTAAYTGVTGGAVVLVADDNGCHSSQNEQDSRYYGRSAGVPGLEPSNAQEWKDYLKLGYEISEKYDTVVLLRSNTRVSHSRGIVELGERTEKDRIPYEKNIQKYVAMPAMARKLHIAQEQRMDRIAKDTADITLGMKADAAAGEADSLPLNIIELNDTKIGIITSGICYQYVKEALPEVSVLKMGMINPIPKAMIEAFAAKVEKAYPRIRGRREERHRRGRTRSVHGRTDPGNGDQTGRRQGSVHHSGRIQRQHDQKGLRPSGSRGCSRCECAGSRRRSVSGRSSWKTAASLCRMSAQRTVPRAEQAEDYCSGRYRLLYAGRAAADVSYGRMPLHGRLYNHGSRIRKSRWKQQEHSCRTGRLHLLPLRYHRSGKYELQRSERNRYHPGQQDHRHDRSPGQPEHWQKRQGRTGSGNRYRDPLQSLRSRTRNGDRPV